MAPSRRYHEGKTYIDSKCERFIPAAYQVCNILFDGNFSEDCPVSIGARTVDARRDIPAGEHAAKCSSCPFESFGPNWRWRCPPIPGVTPRIISVIMK
jgi:hypothetical protein